MGYDDLQAIVFDLDGTLVDSLEDIAAALDLAFDDHELPRPTRDHVRGWIGAGARNLIAQAVGFAHAAAGAPPPDVARIDAVLARFRVHYAAAPVVHTRLYAGIDGVLDQLAARGRKLAVLSNKPHALTVRIAEVVLARWPFAVVFGHREGVPLKPAPDAALEIAVALDVAPAACAFVGDSTVDVATARAAGMVAVAVSWGFRPRAELVAARPVLLADAPVELGVLAGIRA